MCRRGVHVTEVKLMSFYKYYKFRMVYVIPTIAKRKYIMYTKKYEKKALMKKLNAKTIRQKIGKLHKFFLIRNNFKYK